MYIEKVFYAEEPKIGLSFQACENGLVMSSRVIFIRRLIILIIQQIIMNILTPNLQTAYIPYHWKLEKLGENVCKYHHQRFDLIGLFFDVKNMRKIHHIYLRIIVKKFLSLS